LSRPLQLTSWQQHLASRFPQLSAAVVAVLALYSFGMILAKVSGLSAVTLFLAQHLARPYHALRKRLSEFSKPAAAKSGVKHGVKRQDFDVTTCFAPLLRWVLSLWSERHLALAIDVTNLGDRFHVLCVSVVVRGIAIPVAWKALLGGLPEPWNPHWQALLQRLRTAVPDDWTVLVLSDRGLESPALFRQITKLDWHPLMRVKKGGKFRPSGWGQFYSFQELLRAPGAAFAAEGLAYRGQKLRCTLLACWEDGHDEPWLLLTDLPPEAGQAVWYALRSWIEQGFKVLKGGGWDWQQTRMDDPGRVERLWLVLAVATLWVVALGVEDEVRAASDHELQRQARQLHESQQQAQARQEQQRQRLEKQRVALAERQQRLAKRRAAKEQVRQQAKAAKQSRRQAKAAARRLPSAAPRTHRVSRRGLAVLQAAWARGDNPLPRHLHPEPWPQPTHAPAPMTEQEFLSQQT
jgi:hypothetical protein